MYQQSKSAIKKRHSGKFLVFTAGARKIVGMCNSVDILMSITNALDLFCFGSQRYKQMKKFILFFVAVSSLFTSRTLHAVFMKPIRCILIASILAIPRKVIQ
jgi:hypothetical protein